MSISYTSEWINKHFGLSIQGVLHIGANNGQEAAEYQRAGWAVVWIEGDPDIYGLLNQNISQYPHQTAYCCLCSDVSGSFVPFYRASNAGGSSSILKPNEPIFKSFGVHIKECVELKTRRLDEFIEEEKVNLKGINLINLDVQGYELPALKGLGFLLDQFEVVMAELNWSEAYQGCTKPLELEKLLAGHNFRRVFTSVGFPQGSAIWIKAPLRPWTTLKGKTTIRLIQMVNDLGGLRALQNSRMRGFFRKVYYWIKRRPCVD